MTQVYCIYIVKLNWTIDLPSEHRKLPLESLTLHFRSEVIWIPFLFRPPWPCLRTSVVAQVQPMAAHESFLQHFHQLPKHWGPWKTMKNTTRVPYDFPTQIDHFRDLQFSQPSTCVAHVRPCRWLLGIWCQWLACDESSSPLCDWWSMDLSRVSQYPRPGSGEVGFGATRIPRKSDICAASRHFSASIPPKLAGTRHCGQISSSVMHVFANRSLCGMVLCERTRSSWWWLCTWGSETARRSNRWGIFVLPPWKSSEPCFQ